MTSDPTTPPARVAAAGDEPALRLHQGLDLAVAFVWACVLVERVIPVRVPLADYGAFLGMLAVFVTVPAATIVLWWIERPARKSRRTRRRVYFLASRVFLVFSWCASCLGTLLVIALFQPWPLTLIEGPDTDFAREGFERICGHEPPPSVRAVYYRVDGPRDPTFYLRCEGADRALVMRVAQRLYLEPVAQPGALELPPDRRVPSWWPRDEKIEFDLAFTRPSGHEHLWFRESDGLLLYRQETF